MVKSVETRRRTRKQWDEYYKDLHEETKRKEQESSGGGDKRARVGNVVSQSEPKFAVDFDVGISSSATVIKDLGSAPILSNSVYDDGDGDENNSEEVLRETVVARETSLRGVKDSVVEPLIRRVNRAESEDSDSFNVSESEPSEEKNCGGDEDDGAAGNGIDCDDDDKSGANVNGCNLRNEAERVDNCDLGLAENEPRIHVIVSDDSDSFYVSSDKDSDEAVSESDRTSEENEDGDGDGDGDDENSTELSIEKISFNEFILRNTDVEKCEVGQDEVEPRIRGDVSEESDCSIEVLDRDSDDDMSVSESEPTSEEEEEEVELPDEDYKAVESSTTESSDDSEAEEVVKGVEYAVAGNGKRGRVNSRKESEAEQGGELKGETLKEEKKLCKDWKWIRTDIRNESGVETQKGEEGEVETQKSQSKLGCFTSSYNEKGASSADCFFAPCSGKKAKRSPSTRDLDLIKILVNSMNSFKDKRYNINELAATDNKLPLRFRFEDEVVPPVEKSEWEKYLDSLFCDLELGLRESGADHTDPSVEEEEVETSASRNESPGARCSRGEHHGILDEQIGIVCEYCFTVMMDIKHVLPPLLAPAWGRQDRRYYYDEFKASFFSEMQFGGPAASSTIPDSTTYTKGTVWELIPGVEKELYPHQREGFEFMWRNIAGDTVIENLKQTLGEDSTGCIISHAPGTGKTRLTIVFLQTFLKLYPKCSTMIMAPKGMLLSWEAEFKKWNFNVAFHNLNKKELSGWEIAAELLGSVGSGKLNDDCIRMLKLHSWDRGGSVLGISYTLFEKLTGEKGGRVGEQHEKIREALLDRADLLVLDEGHTPRNDKSLIWKAVTRVSTPRRIILSGTPFQNNLKELYNTLCVVNPKLANQESNTSFSAQKDSRRGWKGLSSIERGNALKLRAMLDPFVHVHKGTILEESLPGLSHTLVLLHPTESQKTLLESAEKETRIFRRIRMVSLISVHPSINAVTSRYSASREEGAKFDVHAGVKLRFLLELIYFCGVFNERVLVFSQFIDSLMFIKEQLKSYFSWNEGREVLYMDGQLNERRRQRSISCFNDEKSGAKVLLASEKACSEGINLVGASRVVLLDTVWNPSVEKQAISRAYRIGQKRVVYVYRLFTSGIEVRLRQYPQQIHKERISQWIFSLGSEGKASRALVEDEVLGKMLNHEKFNHIFDKIISQPNESDLIKTFGLGE